MAKPSSLSLSLSLSLGGDTIIQRVKEGYLIWIDIMGHVPKGQRYTIGIRIENKFLDLLEASYSAYFTEKEKKLQKISDCIYILDTTKFLIYVSWEGKLLSNKQYEEISLKTEEIGKMLGGWKKSLGNPEKKNRTL